MADDHDHDHDDDHVHGEGCAHDHAHDAHATGQAMASVAAVLEDLGPCKKLLKVAIPSGEVQREVSRRLEHIRRTHTLKGFRKGKAPRERIERLFGEAVRGDAREHLLKEGYFKAIEDKLGPDKVLGDPRIENVEFSSEGGLTFEVTLHTRPELDLGEYKGLEVKVPPLKVEDKDLEAALDRFRRARGELRPVTDAGAVVEGEDLLAVDLEVWLADEFEVWSQAQEAGKPCESKPLKEEFGVQVQLPSTTLGPYEVEDLADSVQGLTIGQWGECETELPDDYDVVEGRGEPAVVRVKVEAIKRLSLPELTDDWAKEAGFGSVEDLRREVREDLQHQSEGRRQLVAEERIVSLLHQRVGEFALPSDLVDKEVEAAERRRMLDIMIHEQKGEAQAKAAVEEERDKLRTEVERTLRHFFILDEVARREKIRVSEPEVDQRVARMAAMRRQDPKALREELEKHRVMPQLVHDIADEKTRTFLREHAKVVEAGPDE